MRKVPPFWSQVRNYTALASTFIYNLNFFGVAAKNICSPGFNCHGCPWATFSCPVGIIGYGFGVRSIPAFALGSILAVGIALGRLVCGYACPFGLLQEALFRIKTRKFSLPKPLRYLKYIIMVLFVFLLTYIFGFDVSEGYIKINKPVVAKDVPELDIKIFAEKNRAYFANDKYSVTLSKGGFPLPEGFNAAGDTAVSGIKPVGAGANVLGGSNGFSLEDMALEVESGAANSLPVNDAGGSGTLEPIGVAGKSRGAGLGSILAGGALDDSAQSADSGESVFDLLEKAKEDEYKNSQLLVEVSVENLSEHDLSEFALIPVYYGHDTGEEIWRGEEMVFSEGIKAGASFTTDIFNVPYYLHKADIAVLSPQTSVVLDYWTLFCTYCPVAVLEADVPSRISGISDLSQLVYSTTKMNMTRLVLAVVIIIASIFISRFFCRGLCPLGAMYGLVARFAILKIALNKDKCIDCGKCDAVCPVELDVRREVGSSECLSCGDCVNVCPAAALKRKVGL